MFWLSPHPDPPKPGSLFGGGGCGDGYRLARALAGEALGFGPGGEVGGGFEGQGGSGRAGGFQADGSA